MSRRIFLSGVIEIYPEKTWKEIVLPKQTTSALNELIQWGKCRGRVDAWGSLVSGPVALFFGPSGTGKTLAAEVLANALGMPLFRVDLGLLVSKYIGETEKNLGALFDAASRMDAVLFFDEVDSLFGKRSEVQDACDRYVNLEIAYLLERIGHYKGLCILSANSNNGLDPALARRLQFTIEFPVPDAMARSKLWKLHLPPNAPLDKEIDFDLLGREMEMTGGEISSAVSAALFTAAAGSTPISSKHLTEAAYRELSKTGIDPKAR